MVAGSDRIHEFQALADKYNGTKEYEYKSVKVVSSGERDPDAEGVAGMSASKMREMAKNNDFRSFKSGITSLSDSDSKNPLYKLSDDSFTVLLPVLSVKPLFNPIAIIVFFPS